MSIRSLSAALVLGSLAMVPATAQTTGAQPAAAQTQDAAGMSAQAEASPGRSIRLNRFVKRQQKRLMAGDADGDGQISQAEFAAGRTQGNPTRQFARLDTNRDGFVTTVEAEASVRARFQRLDVDGDGVLSASERPKARGQKMGADDAEQ